MGKASSNAYRSPLRVPRTPALLGRGEPCWNLLTQGRDFVCHVFFDQKACVVTISLIDELVVDVRE